ncbi:hypothetical protein FDP41_009844 [Naegleria fowleri]|uniref:transketolase n=1 Tax=Naegleria fowleri TaxID=5763 RepID=A0A6A5B9C5_NAEFO|nr:uncharacterized protein FDP41_009844 [Naegleria fowleri]KAF0971621.1 hypothetical protein FDP41_009844 [Naegleria fowleri]CAG4709443.1 unnamed protein product [Naegleria fowleri]
MVDLTQSERVKVSLFLPNQLSRESRTKISHFLRDCSPHLIQIPENEGEFNCYSDQVLLSSELPDVFSVDAAFLPLLVKNGLIAPLSDVIKEDLSQFIPNYQPFQFALESCRVQSELYGIPNLIQTNVVLQKESPSEFSSELDLAQHKGYDSIVYPDVASSDALHIVKNYALLQGSITSTTTTTTTTGGGGSGEKGDVVVPTCTISLNAFPEKPEHADEHFVTSYRTILNATQIEAAEDLVESCRYGKCIPCGAYIGRLELMCGLKSKIEDEKWNLTLLPFLGKGSTKIAPTVSCIVLNSQLQGQRRQEALKYIQRFFSDTHVDEVLQRGMVIPCDRNRLNQWASNSNIYRDVLFCLEKHERENNLSVLRFDPELTNVEIQRIAKILRHRLHHLAIATLRCLTADMVENAKSGHPGCPIGLSPVAYVLWKYFYRSTCKNPAWFNRDRFILSNGHGCALQYALLHLTGYESMPMEELKRLRKIDSKTPGHPEWRHTEGIEATTGPLGQGVCNSVGMALAEAHLAARFNKEDLKLFNHYVFTFCSDGDMMEGMCNEGLSFAGHQKLNKLIMFYDDNKITIDGSTTLAFTQDTATVARGFGWHVIEVVDADSNLLAIKNAIKAAQLVTQKPSLIICKTSIGYATKHEGSAKAHGSALGADSVNYLKQLCGFDTQQTFFIPTQVREDFKKIADRNAQLYEQWNEVAHNYSQKYPSEWETIMRMSRQELDGDIEPLLPNFEKEEQEGKELATRMTSHIVLNSIIRVMPGLVGGSADLTPSNLTDIEGGLDFQPQQRHGRYIRFGVREHGMVAISNGILYHGLLRSYVGTFLNFASYALGALRLSALAHIPNIYVLTHDSIGLGEDGPTHQPIEVIPVLRAIPNLVVIRPADGRETSGAYLFAAKSKAIPTCLILTRQNVPQIRNTDIHKTLKGAYLLESSSQNPDIILIATGSEVQIIVKASKMLKEEHGLQVNTVSMPSWELFEMQPREYKDQIFIQGVPVLSVEASSPQGWIGKYSHFALGMTTFGASGAYQDIYKKVGITPENTVDKALKLISKFKKSAPPLLYASVLDE